MATASNTAVKTEAKSKAQSYLNNDPRNTPYFDDNQFFKQLDDRTKWAINDRNNQYDKLSGDRGRQFDKEQSIRDRTGDQNYARSQVNQQQDMQMQAINRGYQLSDRTATGAEAYGVGAAAPDGQSYTPYGFKTQYNPSEVANWRMRQDGVLNDQYNQAKRMAGINADNQEFADTQQQNRNIDMMNRQNSLKSQSDANARVFQGKEADKDRANQRYLAQMNLYGSMFNGNGNGFQYWGGTI